MATTTQPEPTTAAVVPQPQQPAPQLYHSPEAERFAMEQRMARVFVVSGLFSDIKGVHPEQAIAQAYVKIALGGSMGFSAAESMQGIDIIQGRPAVSAQLRAARMQRAGFSWAPTVTNKGCWLAMYFNRQPIMVPRVDPATGMIVRDKDGNVINEHAIASYTEDDAKTAKLIDKDNWKKDPSAMYFARAITRAQRRFAPGVLSGDILTREEAFDAEPDGFGPIELKEPRALPIDLSQSQASTVEAKPVTTDNKPAETRADPPPADKVRAPLIEQFEKLRVNLGEKEFIRRLSSEGYTDVSEILTVKMPTVLAAITGA